MAWAGNYQVDYESARHWMMDLSSALGYADVALRNCVEYASGSMLWMQRNDILTRGKLATHVRRGLPGSLALKQALQETHLEWRSPLASPLVGSAGSGHPATPKRRTGEDILPEGEPATKRPRTLKADRFATVSMVKGGKRLCKPFNDWRGCSNGDDVWSKESICRCSHFLYIYIDIHICIYIYTYVYILIYVYTYIDLVV